LKSRESLSRGIVATLALATLLSGFAGLAYEVIWSRMLVLPLGSSADAVAMVLCAFMAGMALGSRALGALSDRIHAPLRIYIGVEVVLALYAVALPFVMPALENASVFGGTFRTAPVTASFRMATTFALVALPAFLMGGTIPVLTRILHASGTSAARAVGLFYGLNTLGGAVGAAITGFVAIALIGNRAVSFIAASFSVLAALLALSVYRRVTAASADTPASPNATAAANAQHYRAGLLIAGVGGFVMLGLELLFARMLTFVFGHDTYAFAVLLVVVLAGMGLGGLLFRATSRRRVPVPAAFWLVALGATTLLSFWLASWLVVAKGRDPFLLGTLGTLSNSLWLEFIRELAYTPILVFLPALASGASLSAACATVATHTHNSGRRIGNALLVNGLAAAAGTLFTSLVLIPRLGLQHTVVALSLLAVVAGLGSALWMRQPLRRAKSILVLAVLAVVALIAMPAQLPKALLQEAVGERHQEILYYAEGRTGTVSVTENRINGERQLFMNAVNEVTTRLVHDQSFKLLGHLGPLLHPHPKSGLMICYGAGISAGAALMHPFDKFDVVDLSETIAGASHLFVPWNNDALADPRLHLHIEDGRQFLLRNTEKRDVIMVDSTHPKSVDSWLLYTVRFYELVRAALSEDGIFVQWLPLHGLSETEFRVIVRTFIEVFPDMSLWLNVGNETYGQAAYVKMVGARHPLRIDYAELSLRLREPRIYNDLQPYGMADPIEILDTYISDAPTIRAFVGDLPPQTDNRPFIPYITAYSDGPRMEARNLLPIRTSVVPVLDNMGEGEAEVVAALTQASEAMGFLMADMLEAAHEVFPAGQKIRLYQQMHAQSRKYYLQLAAWYSDDAFKLFESANYLGNLGFTKEALEYYDKALALRGNDNRFHINRSLALRDLGRLDDAISALQSAVTREPKNALAHYNLGICLMESGDALAALAEFDTALALRAGWVDVWISKADALIRLERYAAAEEVLRRLVGRAAWRSEVWDMLGVVAGSRNEWERARQHHATALSRDPYRADAHYNMGLALMHLGRLRESAAAFLTVLRLTPEDAEAANNLGLVFAGVGAYDEAIRHHLHAIELRPDYAEAAYNLGLAYRAKGDVETAERAFRMALDFAPDLQPALERLAEIRTQRAAPFASSPDTDTGTDTDAGTGADAGTDTGTATGTDAGTDTGTATGTDAGNDPAAPVPDTSPS